MKHWALYSVATVVVIVVAGVLLYSEVVAPETAEEQPDAHEVSTAIATTTIPADITAHIASKADAIILESPQPFSAIHSPVTLIGTARGTWFFEASFPVVVVNWDGLIIGEGIATATKDWMTEDFVPFAATVAFTVDPTTYSNKGALILKRDNPSGLPEYDDALEIPVVFAAEDAVELPPQKTNVESAMSTLADTAWIWQRLVKQDGDVVMAKDVARFELRFAADGSFSAGTDCNSAGGSYTVVGNTLTVGQMMSTMMYCEGSQEQEYLAALGTVTSFKYVAADMLELTLKDGGVMTYRAQKEE